MQRIKCIEPTVLAGNRVVVTVSTSSLGTNTAFVLCIGRLFCPSPDSLNSAERKSAATAIRITKGALADSDWQVEFRELMSNSGQLPVANGDINLGGSMLSDFLLRNRAAKIRSIGNEWSEWDAGSLSDHYLSMDSRYLGQEEKMTRASQDGRIAIPKLGKDW